MNREKPDRTQENKNAERGNIPRDVEIESIKRTLYNALDKLDRLKSNQK